MRKTTKITIILIGLLAVSIYVALEISNTYAQIQELEAILNPKNIGVIFRPEQEQDLQALRQKYLGLEIVLFILIAFLLLSFALLIPHSERTRPKPIRPRNTTPTTLRLCALLFIILLTLTNNACADNLYFRPRAQIPVKFEYKILQEATCSMTVRYNTYFAGFVAYMIAIGNIDSKEFLEIGYSFDSTGFWLYSSSEINKVYNLKEFTQPNEWESYDFQVIKIGSKAYAKINGVLMNQVTWTTTDGTFLFIAQGESTYPYNKMCGVFRNLEIGYWKPDDTIIYDEPAGWIYVKKNWFVAYTTVIDEYPYDITMISASPYYTGADITGGMGTPSGSPDDAHPQTFGGGGTPRPR